MPRMAFALAADTPTRMGPVFATGRWTLCVDCVVAGRSAVGNTGTHILEKTRADCVSHLYHRSVFRTLRGAKVTTPNLLAMDKIVRVNPPE